MFAACWEVMVLLAGSAVENVHWVCVLRGFPAAEQDG